MKDKLRQLIAWFTGLMFAAYSVYYIFVLIKDVPIGLSSLATIINAALVLLFSVLAGFMFTSGVENIKFRILRRWLFIAALFAVLLLKLRISGRTIALIDFSRFQTVLYGAAFFMTVIGLLILLVYFLFICKTLLSRPKAKIIWPLAALIMFLGSFVCEIIMTCVYHIWLDSNMIRSLFSRPVFHFAFIGLSLYFMIVPQPDELEDYDLPADNDIVRPDEDGYIAPEGAEDIKPDESYILSGNDEYVIPEASVAAELDDTYFVAAEEEEYMQPAGESQLSEEDSDYVISDSNERDSDKRNTDIDAETADYIMSFDYNDDDYTLPNTKLK